ncbi:alpha/beta fold hydrolase [Lichenifustis flavocetrariae]|uniref:Alpha/beta fold hydrolase n=1 Tax=Lichenifustis flavocetrariae TaxID=2949735 RepID=A0AA41YVL7_9HYPH|nr:alpha/beta fold hydrolase [Lichenifustis flavocetrariae]MCW6507753.1 alpha/beta fold hydrolase [Lichenifustis flavocetrariae]
MAATSLSALATAMASPASAQSAPGKTFVFAHGSWHGGWSWQRVADRLRALGHRAFTPSFTGMGDREHLLTKAITIDTFIEDLSEVIKTEELSDVILVAHSFGGVPITGVADRLPEKLRHLVYLDSIVLENGQTGFSVYPPKEAEDRIAAATKANGGVAVPIPKALPAAWGFTEGTPDYAWVLRRITPTPLNAYLTPLTLHAPFGNGVPKTYIHCVKPENPVIEGSRALVRSQPGWNWIDFPGPHDSMITDPDGIVNLLLKI